MAKNFPGSKYLKLTFSCFLIAAFIGFSHNSNAEHSERKNAASKIIIQCTLDCADVESQLKKLGGKVNYRYSAINAIAATIPAEISPLIEQIQDIKGISEDKLVQIPTPINKQPIRRDNSINLKSLRTIQLRNELQTSPRNYSFNNHLTGASELHALDIQGQDVIVAIIDSGTADNPEIVPALAGSVIGGESFVDLPGEPSATSTLNDSHGTLVGSMIAAHMGVVVNTDSDLVQSLYAHAPDSVISLDNNESLIPMMGSAPLASLYAMKIFPSDGSGASTSTIVAALDRVLTLKRNYNAGMPSVPVSGDGSEDNPHIYHSLNIQVVNMSLGGATHFPAYSLEDLMVLELLKEGVTVVSAAGNEGFAAFTGGSPGTSVGSLTVGATTTAAHERILRDMQFGLGIGELFRPDNNMQIAFFSSRGPTADGRAGLQIMANGFASFAQGADGEINFVSGTSFSAPTVSGTAALLWQVNSDAKAAEIRDALMQAANLTIMENDNDGLIDYGHGFTSVPNAYEVLLSGQTNNTIPRLPEIEDQPSEIEENIEDLNLTVIELEDDHFYSEVELSPGEVSHFFVESSLETDQILIELTNVNAQLPIDQQNQLFGDALLINIVDAPTSYNDFLVEDRILENTQYTIDKPQSGVVRVAVLGDWTNAGTIYAQLKLSASERKLIRPIAKGRLRDDEVDTFEINVNDETTQLNFELSWKSDWGHYPAHDIDLILLDPQGIPNFDAATLDSPERLTIDNPQPGQWTVFVTGYMLHGFTDKYTLRISDQNNFPLKR